MVQWALSGLLLVKYTETTRNVRQPSSHEKKNKVIVQGCALFIKFVSCEL